MRSIDRALLVLLACVALNACGDRRSPLEPIVLPPTAPPQPAPSTSIVFRVISGADQTPVAHAAVSIADASYTTDADGYFTAEASAGAAVDVDAAGFLPRRTKFDGGRFITLWPTADDVEAAALRAMVYQREPPNSEVLLPRAPGSFYVSLREGDGGVMRAWAKEADAFGAEFGLTYEVTSSFQYETNELSITFSSNPPCQIVPTWGFCRDPNPYYRIYHVSPARALEPGVIRRVLTSWFLGRNPLPGFMNADAPSEALSPFEAQTIRLILQRPHVNRWPDTDR